MKRSTSLLEASRAEIGGEEEAKRDSRVVMRGKVFGGDEVASK